MSDRYESAQEALNELDNELKKTAVISEQFRGWLMMMARSIAIAARRDGLEEAKRDAQKAGKVNP